MASDTVYVGQLICDSTTPPPDRGFYKINDTTTGHVGKLVMSDPVSGKESVALTATLSDGRVRVSAGGAPITLLTADPSSPAPASEDLFPLAATGMVKTGGGYLEQIRGVTGPATVTVYDSVDQTGRQIYTGTIAAGGLVEVSAFALNAISATISGGSVIFVVREAK